MPPQAVDYSTSEGALVTEELLIRLGIQRHEAGLFAPALSTVCGRFNINSVQRVAGFLAQCRVESNDFCTLQEDLYYKTPEIAMKNFSAIRDLAHARTLMRNPQALANVVYANRYGNGDVASGDGWRFSGKGVKQLTFRRNYEIQAIKLGRPYVEQPELLLLPDDACLTAGGYWDENNCNALADAGDWDGITRAVNGKAMLQKARRRALSLMHIELMS